MNISQNAWTGGGTNHKHIIDTIDIREDVLISWFFSILDPLGHFDMIISKMFHYFIRKLFHGYIPVKNSPRKTWTAHLLPIETWKPGQQKHHWTAEHHP